jgi:hypothetical protein
MGDKRIEVSFHAAAKAQAAQTLKQHMLGRGDEGNSDKLTPGTDKSLKDKERKDKAEKREKREKDNTRQNKKP